MERIQLIIPNKIVDEQLLLGQKIEFEYITLFNNTVRLKIFPDDFSLEEQGLFKKVYEEAVYGSEVGNKIYKCSNQANTITINGYKRIEPTELGAQDFDITEVIKLKFTRFGIKNTFREIEYNFSESVSQSEIEKLLEIGILLSSTNDNLTIDSYNGDISIEIIKEDSDSFIDLGDFKNGTLILSK